LLVSLALLTHLRAADDEPAVKALVAEASKACDELPKTRRPGLEAKQAWLNLAQAKVNAGDVEGGIAALDRVNSDHDYSVCSAWVMETEATGKVPPEPKDVDEQVLMVHRVGVVRTLIALADYEGALAQVQLLPKGEARDVSLTRCYIESAQAQLKDDQMEAALASYNKAMEAAQQIKSAKTGVPCLLDICRGLIDCDLELAARPLLDNVEGALDKQAAAAQTSASIKGWLEIGKIRLLLADAAAANKNFAKAKTLYTKFGEPRTGVAWAASPFPAYQHKYRWEAHHQRKEKEEAAAALKEWTTAIANVDDQFASPDERAALVEALLIDGNSAEAWKVLDGLDPGQRSLTLMQIRRTPESRESKSINLELAEYCQEQFQTGPEKVMRTGALTLACECYAKAGEREKSQACLAQALELSEANDRENHGALAALMVEMGESDQAKKILSSLKGPERALALSEMALESSRKLCEAKLSAEVQARRNAGPKVKRPPQ
jgi:tetratricopeptide (TPR) repeat protein